MYIVTWMDGDKEEPDSMVADWETAETLEEATTRYFELVTTDACTVSICKVVKSTDYTVEEGT